MPTISQRDRLMRAARFAVSVVVLACLALSAPSRARGADPPGAPHAGDVDRVFAQWDKPDSPGCAVAVIKDGQVVYKRGYGRADLDHDIAIAPDTVFHAASLSKQFTAMAVMLLVAQGKVSLDDDVRSYVPELPDLGVPIRIRHLLHHTSGLRDQWILVTMAGVRLSDDVVTEDDVLQLVSRMKGLDARPGDELLYSNTGYTLAALVVRRATGLSLRAFTEANIFAPLGMRQTRFRERHGLIVARHAYGYRRGSDGSWELRMPNYDLVGPSNLLTTVEDLARWDQNFYDGTVGGAALLAQMQTPATPGDGQSPRYGMGLFLWEYRGLRIVEHDGRDAGYRSHLIRFPDQRFSVACLCNVATEGKELPGALARQVADIYLADRLGPEPAVPAASAPAPAAARPAPAALAEYEGAYYSGEIDATYRLIAAGGSLVLARRRYPATTLEPDAKDAFIVPTLGFLRAAKLRFARDGAGRVIGFTIDGDRIRNFQFIRLRADEAPGR